MKAKILTLVLFTTLMMYFNVSAQVSWSLDTVITTGSNSSGIAITHDGSKLVVTNNTKPGKVKIISTSTYSVSSIDISSTENYPNGVAIAPNDSLAYVNTLHKTVFIDLISNSVKGSFSAPCVGTTLYGLAVTPNGNNVVFPDLSSGCTRQGLRTISANSPGSSSTYFDISTAGELYGIAITNNGASAVVTDISKTAKIVNLSTAGIQNIAGMTSSYGIALMHKSNEALIYGGDSVYRVSLTSNKVTKTISNLSFTSSFQNIAITDDDKYAFVTGAFEKLVIQLSDNSVIQTFTAGGTNVATNADGSRFYVTDSYNGTVRVYKMSKTTGVEDAENAASGIEIYPNPTNGRVKIYSRAADIKDIEIYNYIGQRISVLNSNGQAFHEIDLGARPAGIYLVKINTMGGSCVRKIVKQE